MAKKVKRRKSKAPLAFIILVIIAAAGVYAMFFAMPSGDAVKTTMEKEDFNVFADVNKDTPILGALLPEGANRSIIFVKTLNSKTYRVVVLYFNDYQSAKEYYDSLETEPDEGDLRFIRGNAVMEGTEESVKKLRWKVWII